MIRPPLLLLAWTWLLSGCAISPPGEREERDKAKEAGRAWTEPAEIPELPPSPTPEDYLRRAFLANAELQARYWEWRAALEQIPQDASFPNVAFSFSYMFSDQNMKSWDRTTLGVANDPMANIPFPTKLATAGRRALEQARVAGLRFEEAKFLLQGRVLATYGDYALLAESIRIQEEGVALLRQVVGQASVRVQTGAAGSQDLLRAQTELELAENELSTQRARVPALAARLNGLLGRAAEEPLPLPTTLLAPRALPVSDAELIRLGSERSPGLSGLAKDIAGREEALNLAKQAYLPDFGLSFDITGSVSRSLGGMLVLPTRLAAIRAGIEQAQASLRAAEAARVQYGRDLAASFVLNLVVLRNDDRQMALFESSIVPRARQAVQITQTAYAANRSNFLDLIDTQRTLLSARLTLAQLRTEREKALAAIETWSAVDVETLDGGVGVGSAGMGGRASWTAGGKRGNGTMR